jgi:hypothetical protein
MKNVTRRGRMSWKATFGIMLTLLLIGTSTLAFNVQVAKASSEEVEVVPMLPAPPSSPQPNYTWVDTNETFLYVSYEGKNYSTGLAFGLYLPETIELNKKYSMYIYMTRIFQSENITLPLESPLSIKICLGMGIETPPCWWRMHIGLGFDLLWWGGWDLWTYHLPLPLPSLCGLSLSTSYPNVTYSNILEIPLNEWDGPYEAQFTLTGYVQIEAILVEFENVSYGLNILTNSLISDFAFSQSTKSVSFNVSGDPGIVGFCNVTIPKTFLSGPWQVRIDNSSVPFKEMENSTHSFLYFTYNHSTKTVQIIGTHVIPEFSTWLLLLALFVLATVIILVKIAVTSKGEILTYRQPLSINRSHRKTTKHVSFVGNGKKD